MTLRSRLGTRRAELIDRSRRLGHALRHARLRPASRPSGVFNLDLHVSVIADVATALDRRAVGLTSWSLSDHTWVFGAERQPVAVVNELTYRDFDAEMARRFRRAYGTFLRGFAGFVATHTPCFSLLYEGLARPTLGVCSTRYEWPFTTDRERWGWLDAGLRRGVEDGWLQLIGNNRADVDYVANYAGIEPEHIPSACAYVTSRYTGHVPTVVVCAKRDDLAASIARQLQSDAVPLRAGLGPRYSWADLYGYRALVVIPYNVSIMSLFEHYAACAPIYVPARDFLKRLRAEYPTAVLSQVSYAQIVGRGAAAPTSNARDLNDLDDEDVVDWYLDRADFYDSDWMPRIRQFESWAHLDHLLATDDHLAISEQMAAESEARFSRIAALWDGLDWLRRVAAEPPDAR